MGKNKYVNKVHLGVNQASGLPTGLQYPYCPGANQADVCCYYVNLQVDMRTEEGNI